MQNELKLNFDKIISLNNFSDSQKKIKRENFNNYFEKCLPNRRNEDWKFSDINQIISKNFDNFFWVQMGKLPFSRFIGSKSNQNSQSCTKIKQILTLRSKLYRKERSGPKRD